MSVVDAMQAKRVTDEIRQAHDDLEYFYLEAKRNKKIAKWAAKLLGLEPQAYFLELISADLTKAGPKPVVDRILSDFNAADIQIEEAALWLKVREFEQKILKAMLDEQAARTKKQMKAKAKHQKAKSKSKK